MDTTKLWSLFADNQSLWWYGIKITLLLAIVGTLIGLAIGLLLGCIRTTKIEKKDNVIVSTIKHILHAISSVYIWFFRGTPMMVQAMFIYHFLRPILNWDVMSAGIVIISLNTGAYMAEIIRSGIQSVDEGQIEGSRSIGMSNTQTMLSIVIPQAIKNSFPSIGNQFIINIKDSSMLNVIGVIELFFQTRSISGSNMLGTETYFIACIMYLVLTTLASMVLNMLEKRMGKVKCKA